MKTFMEEYGLIIVGILVVAALIGLAVNFSQDAKKNSEESIKKFNDKANTYIDKGLTDGSGSTTTDQGGTNQGGTK